MRLVAVLCVLFVSSVADAEALSGSGSPHASWRPDSKAEPQSRSGPAPRRTAGTPPRPLAKTKQPKANGGPRPPLQPREPEVVPFPSSYSAGSIVIDTRKRRLYYVRSDSTAWRYPISVGRDGFQWAGSETISRTQSWPDWRPPQEMRERDPELPVLMTGGLKNPLGAMAIYLGDSLYRIHGTNDVRSIGRAASSGCFRMRNEHVLHLAANVEIGAQVHVLDRLPHEIAQALPDDEPRQRKRRKSRS
ncbi:MAG: L,D-transpeptidase [Hyphomicrobiaceae bacterium]|nr:L,D-transpeptidase [Hyphomicrobiaceae bacterium]